MYSLHILDWRTEGIEVSFSAVFPSQSLADLVERQLRKRYPHLNYRVDWEDTHGYGLCISYSAAWDPNFHGPFKKDDWRHVSVPRMQSLFRNPGYDLVNM